MKCFPICLHPHTNPGTYLPSTIHHQRSSSALTFHRWTPNFPGKAHLSTRSFDNSSSTLLPQTTDLLQTYQGLVTLGKIQSDPEQIRVVTQLRRLQKDLVHYAPPALTSHYLDNTPTINRATEIPDEPQPWWFRTSKDAEVSADLKALVRVKTHAEDLATLTTPKGLLLTGPPGSGKSFLVDLWFNAVPTPYKARKHYNQLVLEVYRAVWEETQLRMDSVHGEPSQMTSEPTPSWSRKIRESWRKLATEGSLPARWTRRPNIGYLTASAATQNTIAFAVAQRLILRHWLLVFDEIQLLDVSSATLLADVLSWFWRFGGIIVGTSNKVPDDLYKNGVQRERLEPFVEAMKVRCPVISMRTERDWREVRAGTGIGRTWYTYDNEPDFRRKMNQLAFGSASEGPMPRVLTVFGRALNVPWTRDDTCKFTFQELCNESLGPADYLTLASTFRTVVLIDVPILKLSAKDQARRFISLIDALYESRCRIVCLAETEPENLFFPDAFQPSSPSPGGDIDMMMAEAVGAIRNVYRPNVSSYDNSSTSEEPSISHTSAPALDTLSIFSGKDEQFAFKRALSRLLEMTSETYQRDELWAPLPTASRKWERIGSTGGKGRTLLSMQDPSVPRFPSHTQSDFAEEAASEGDVLAGSLLRPEAPRIRAEHVWGVHDEEGMDGAGDTRVESRRVEKPSK